MKRRREAILAGMLCVLSLGPASTEAQKPKAKQKSQAPVELAWPPPPDRPRIRFVAAISSAEDVTGKVKRSFAERLAGVPPLREQLRLMRPYGVAVDKADRIFVADPAQRSVLVLDREGHSVSRWKGNAQFPLYLPIGLAFDSDGRLFVSDSFAGQVVIFEPTGKPVAAFGKSVFKRPGGMAFDGKRGRLYVADAKLNQILFFDARTLQLLKAMGGQSTSGAPEEGRFSAPTNLALDSTGNLYVVDTWNCRVQVFDPEGNFVRTFGTQGNQPGKFVRPKGIAIDSEDHVYVVDAGFSNFQIFTPEGKPLLFIGSMGEQPGEFLLPTGMAIDGKDRVYVTEQGIGRGRLQVFQYLSEKLTASSDGKMD